MDETQKKLLSVGGNTCRAKPTEAVAVKLEVDNLSAVLYSIPGVTGYNHLADGALEIFTVEENLDGLVGDYIVVYPDARCYLYKEELFLDKYDVYTNPKITPTNNPELNDLLI